MDLDENQIMNFKAVYKELIERGKEIINLKLFISGQEDKFIPDFIEIVKEFNKEEIVFVEQRMNQSDRVESVFISEMTSDDYLNELKKDAQKIIDIQKKYKESATAHLKLV